MESTRWQPAIALSSILSENNNPIIEVIKVPLEIYPDIISLFEYLNRCDLEENIIYTLSIVNDWNSF